MHSIASWCAEALRGYSGGGAGARLELGGALAALRAAAAPAGSGGSALAAGARVLQRLKAVARAHHDDRVLRAEASADAAFVAYAVTIPVRTIRCNSTILKLHT